MDMMKFEDPAFELPDGRRFIIKRMFGYSNDPMISELRPVVDQAGNRLYAFDTDGDGFLLMEYGANKTGAIRAAEFFWGKPSQETWGNISRPLPRDYDDKIYELMNEHGADALERMSAVQCVEGCCDQPLSLGYDRWRLSAIEQGRLMARAVLRLASGEYMTGSDEHTVYKTPPHITGDAVKHDQFIRMVQMFGEPFDQSNGNVNPVYMDVLEQYRDNGTENK